MSDEIKKEEGEKRVFSTGAKRQASSGKGTPSLIPGDAILDIAKHFEKGAVMYGGRNWEKGLTLSSILDSLERHLQQEKMGETDEPHARALAWNAIVYLATKIRIEKGILPPELADVPSYEVAPGLLDANRPGDMFEDGPEWPTGTEKKRIADAPDGTCIKVEDVSKIPSLVLPDENVVKTTDDYKVRSKEEMSAIDANVKLPINHPDREFYCEVSDCFERGKPNVSDEWCHRYLCPKHIDKKGD